ncbi:PAP/25A-associated [Dillenia turbinata]|uniref:polynucleotide adenylyltransferase n=1 Tax=Dillenia turbinata TaxID=194707 RepID=A0AAN8ZM56_9MAGN
MENGFLYETLDLLPDGPPPPPTDESSEPYYVCRNQISLSSLQLPSPETAAADYFSLDVNADNKDQILDSPVVTPVATPTRNEGEGERERGLEGSWFRGNCQFKSPMLQLHKEIVDFSEFLSPTPEELASRNSAVERVFDVIKYIWPYCKVEVFGSFKTGLYLPSSDIDVVILNSNINTPQRGLQALSRALSQRGIGKKIQVISKARVPIIKFIEKKSEVSFDISFDVENGPKAAEFIKDAVSKLPPLRPLCLILKVFLQQRELNEVYSGGIGSYALLTMIIAMLQDLHECQAKLEHNLGVLLVTFFDFYGRKLNTTDVGVSCNGATFFSKKDRGFTNRGRPCLISIEDPQAPENDIGKNSFNYFQIRSAFAMAFSTLTNASTIIGLGPNRSILGTIIRADPALLKRKGGSNGDVTFNSLLTGAGEPIQLQVGDQQEILCNWRMDEEEEPLPRGNGSANGNSPHSSGKKRKVASASKDKSMKKLKENMDGGNAINKENGSTKERINRRRQRSIRRGGDDRKGSRRQNGGSPNKS